MKRGRDRRLTSAERRSMLFVAAALAAILGLGVWLNMSRHEIIPAKELDARSGQDLRIPISGLRQALLVNVDGAEGKPVRIFLRREENGRVVVTFAACRRCDRVRLPSRVSQGQLICGHCGEAMPILDEGATLPNERDCTSVPVQFKVDGDSLVVRAADIEVGRPLFAGSQD